MAQIGFFHPVMEGLLAHGVHLDPILKKSNLDKFNLDDEHAYVPLNLVYSFINEVANSQGISDVAGTFCKQLNLASLTDWGEMIAYTPDLLNACQLASLGVPILTNERIQFSVYGNRAVVSQHFVDPVTDGWDQANVISFAYMLDGFRLACGENWAPLEVHLQNLVMPDLDKFYLNQADTEFYLGAPATAIIFPTSLLTLPMLDRHTPGDFEKIQRELPDTLTSAVAHMLDSTREGYIPKMKSFVELLDIPERTIHRRLSQEGSTYQNLVDKWRFKSAIRLLTTSNLKIQEVSEMLGYANTSNFERAFRRWTNTTPRKYRQMEFA